MSALNEITLRRAPVILVEIPGSPQPQQRVKATVRGGHAAVYEPSASRSWKGVAQFHMLAAVRAVGGLPWAGDAPVRVEIVAVFACPTSDYRKREPRERRWHTGSRGDVDNIAKAVLDAGNGTLWNDDRSVSQLAVQKLIGAQGEAPSVTVVVAPLEPLL